MPMRLRVCAFTLTLVLSAGLLFAVQPMFAKMALPLFGGSPAVWNTSMLFFQAALLLGYGYAHWISSRLSIRQQVGVHAALLLAAMLVLPIGIPADWTPDRGGDPGLTLFWTMLLAIGAPFVVVSATAPLLQSWFGKGALGRTDDPYFLYAASNFGSLTALLAYPVAIEPLLDLRDQSAAWSGGFVLLVGFVVACGLATLVGAVTVDGRSKAGSEAIAPISAGRRLHWIALSFVPSSLLLSATTYITTDIAAVPLLWIAPLALYLLSFVVTFARTPLPRHSWVLRITPYVVVLFLIASRFAVGNSSLLLSVHLVFLFTLALMCHGELARLRPPAANLTEFYLLMSLGGVLGGVFNAMLAPLLFNDLYEYPLAIVLACLLYPGTWDRRPSVAVGIAIAVLAVALITEYFASDMHKLVKVSAFGALGIVTFGCYGNPLRFGLAAAAILSAPLLMRAVDGSLIEQERNFFGVYKVREDATRDLYVLSHGTTVHGAQQIGPDGPPEPIAYYSRRGPVGQLFASLDPASLREVGIVGLGAGSISCYRQPGQNWTFFEINPSIVAMALSGRHFTFMKSCAPDARVVVGDARLSLQSERSGRFDMLVLDAFSSDSIPVHLLTREAFQIYLDKLEPDGLLAIHVSNHYLNLVPVVANLGGEMHMKVLEQTFIPSSEEADRMITGAMWMVLSKNAPLIARLAGDTRWREIAPNPRIPTWTDSYSNIWSVMR
jgi:hypothetical protein